MHKSYCYLDASNVPTTHYERARVLQKNLTDAERKLWFFLRKKQLSSLRFRRHEPWKNVLRMISSSMLTH